jgi:hypothetical protein
MTRRALNKHLRVQVLARDGYRCLMCGRTSEAVALEIDHVLAVADGGSDEISNLATLCKDCNLGKSAYRFRDYREVRVVPDALADQFTFCADDVTGDFRRFHLYLYCKRKAPSDSSQCKFEHSWTISGTAYDTSADPTALVDRRRNEETDKFVEELKCRLIANRQRLVANEEGLWCVEA